FLTVQDVKTAEEVHRDTLFLGTLAPGAVISNLPFSKTFTPPAKAARYACFYQVKADLNDEDLTNNTVRWTFEVTDSVFGKARSLNAVPSYSYFDPIFGQPFEVGNCYFIPPNPGKQWASSVSFSFVGSSDLPPSGMELQVALYKWKTASGFGDVNGDTLANADEFEQVTFTNATVEDTDYRKLITVPLDPNGEWQPFELEDSTYYFVTVANPSSNLPMYIAASEEVDYTAMFWLSYQFNLPMFVSMLRKVGEPDFIANAWALRRIPFIRLNMVSLTPGEEVKTEPLALEIQPNPASGEFFLTVENGKMQRQVAVEICDAAGRLQAVFEFKNTIVSQLAIPVESLRNGFYFVKVTTEAGIGTQKLAVFRK
ncbi:MAG: T9SS type A sorting domain-containing protein, partial [Bacteroidota bacterium]